MNVIAIGSERFVVSESSAGGFNVFKIFGRGPASGFKTFVGSAHDSTEGAIRAAVERGRAAGEI